jgi:hypothetical protein
MIRRQDLEGDVTADAFLDCEVYDRHAAFAQDLEDFVTRDVDDCAYGGLLFVSCHDLRPVNSLIFKVVIPCRRHDTKPAAGHPWLSAGSADYMRVNG